MLFPPNEEENGRRETGLMGIYPFALSFLLFVVVVVVVVVYLFILCTKDMRVNLYNLYFLSYHFFFFLTK